MKMNKPFSFRERCRSIQYALKGIRSFFRQEHNTWIHLAATLVVIVLAFVMKVTAWEGILLVIVTGLVWSAELFNTAIERTADLISEKEDARIKFIKDISAAAVLVMALVAVITGLIIFIPKF